MENNNRGKILAVIVIVVLLAILGVLGYIVYDLISPSPEINSQVTTTAQSEPDNNSNSGESELETNPINFDELKAINPEIIAYIQIPGTNVDYPVLQSMDSDDYYLHRDIYGNYKYAGSIYMQICNLDDFTDRVTVLYGHNMANGSMFADLHDFEDTEFFNSHKEFYIYTEDRKLTYEIVSAYVYDDRHIMNSFNFAEDSVFLEYLDFIQNPRSTLCNSRELNRELTVEDRVVTLSTCLDNGDGRYLLQGVLIEDEPVR